MMNNPLVSILIPSYNAAPWLVQTIESALAQTYRPIEVLVIDDGSSDESASLLERFGTKIKCLTRENRGGNPTRNELFEMSSGDWVQFLDADDYLEPEKITIQMSSLKTAEDPELIDLIYSPVRTEYHREKECVGVAQPAEPVSSDPWVLHARWELTQTGGALFRRSALAEVGAWNEEQACCQDNELFFRFLKAEKKFLYCQGAVAVYRRFEDGTVSTRRREQVVDEILNLLNQMEDYLQGVAGLNEDRLNAINHHRFWLARNIWPWAPQRSRKIMAQVRTTQANFQPERSRFAPALYQFCYRCFGFDGAEKIAAARRRLTRKTL